MIILSLILCKCLVKCRYRDLDKGYKCVGGGLNGRCDRGALPLHRVVNSLEALQGPSETSLWPNTSGQVEVRISTICQHFCLYGLNCNIASKIGCEVWGRFLFFFFYPPHWFKLMLFEVSDFPFRSIFCLGTY